VTDQHAAVFILQGALDRLACGNVWDQLISSGLARAGSETESTGAPGDAQLR
jgi:hypothetical protein